MANLLERWTYAAGQGARVAWFAGHHLAARRIGGRLDRPDEAPFKAKASWPTRAAMGRAIRTLFEKDWTNIEQGLYAAPPLGAGPGDWTLSLKFLKDVPKVERRRMARGHSEVLNDEARAKYPRYFLQNFHFQTGGWLSEESANLYDVQVEALFAGTADAMRRQGVAPIARHMMGRDQRRTHLVDIGCGTGRFLAEIKRNWPRLNTTALDLSAPYLAKARKTLKGLSAMRFVESAAESMPLPDASQDIVTAVYLFHELPPKTRVEVAREIARILKPGGILVLVDSIQTGDDPALDALLEAFPHGFHEPYFASYAKTDLAALFAGAGLSLSAQDHAFLTKTMAFAKA